jgi:hypothetical protein
MNLVDADSRGGSRVLADVVVADPTRSTAVMVTAVERGHAARLAAEMTWLGSMAITSRMTPSFRLR